MTSGETPPRAWGRRGQRHRQAEASRNTPTGVGKTVPICSARWHGEKHPHGRGEDTNILLKIAPSQLQIVVVLLVE